MLLRKVYISGTDPSSWLLIDEIHKNTESRIKWSTEISEKFPVLQGVKQGGLLSADLYKVYIEDLLNTFENTTSGCEIGETLINAVACADDVAIVSENPHDLQYLVNIAAQYSEDHHYLLQPLKSVVLQVQPSNRKKPDDPVCISINNNTMPVTDKSPHLGILRSTTSQKTQDATVEQNITKSRRAAYSLMSAGMHGENGLDPSTAIQLFRTFVQPILTYGLEVILPTSQNLLKLEKFQKKILKQILSLPISAPDPSIYILSGILPIEAQIDQKSLNLFNNICNQNEENLEKKIARRQLIAKNEESNSWFIAIKRVLFKYDLHSPIILLNDPPTKYSWKKSVRSAIDRCWKNVLIQKSCTYKSLKYLGTLNISPRKCHTLLFIGNTSDLIREVVRISVKLKVITDT
ncbi:unnamed protein product [Mytilus coruscus]|uniref:Reverse transcriptase domain-containing protein n=1 Tax=Mytilus coruscus TaxID=42192 RepID=A0A6J8AJS7_MYTCO|nr:unnamed protein product [Mytilus coruscus]